MNIITRIKALFRRIFRRRRKGITARLTIDREAWNREMARASRELEEFRIKLRDEAVRQTLKTASKK